MGIKVRELRPGRWYIVVHGKGKRITKLVGGSKTEAEDYARELRRELKLQGLSALDVLKVLPSPELTVGRYAARWEVEVVKTALKKSTTSSYLSHLKNHIRPAFENYALGEITYGVLKDFVTEKVTKEFSPGRRYSKDTIRIMVATMRALMEEAKNDGLIEANPVTNLGKFFRAAKSKREEPDPFSLEELHKAERSCQENWPVYYEFVLCMSRTGLRIGEALGLQVPDIDFQAGQLRVRRSINIFGDVTSPKNKSSRRTVDMSPQLVNAIQSMLRRRAELYLKDGKVELPEWVFCNREGNPFDYSNFSKAWTRIQKKAEVRRRRPHDLRHTYATQMLSAGKPLAYVSAQLGHKSPRITLEVYSHWIPEQNLGDTDILDVKPKLTVVETENPRQQASTGGRKRL
jgi:integrase